MDKGHGRVEIRELTRTTALNDYLDWPHLGQVCRVDRTRHIREKTEREVAYFVTSLKPDEADAAMLLSFSRGHWGAIENGVHYIRDKTLDEDRCTIYREHAPHNLAAFRNAVLNWLRRLGTDNFAAQIRSFTRNSQRLFTRLGILK